MATRPRPGSGAAGPLFRIAVEFGPLAVFFLANQQVGIVQGTAWFMGTTAVALAASVWVERRLPLVALVGCAFVVVFGALTLAFEEDTFIMVRATVVNLLFAAVLVGGLLAGRPILKSVLGDMFRIDDAGWRILSWRLVGFFVLLAALNELFWRFFPVDVWIAYKVFGVLPLNALFGLAQWPLLRRHRVEAPAPDHSAACRATAAPPTARSMKAARSRSERSRVASSRRMS